MFALPHQGRRLACGLAVFALTLLAGHGLRAQDDVLGTGENEEAKPVFGAEQLVGDAVSFSNRDYPNIDQAIQRFKNGDAESAREFLVLARDETKRLPPVDVMMAKLFLASRNAQGAHAALERAVKEEPTDPEAYLILASQAISQGRITEANALYDFALPIVEAFTNNTKRRQRFDIQLLAGRAAVLEVRGQWEEAQKLLQQWLETEPDNPAALQRLAVTSFRLGSAKDAFEYFKKARELSDQAPYPYVALGRLFTQDDELDKARKAFEKAYEETDGEPATARAYAEWLIQQRDFTKADEVATALLAKDENSVANLLLVGVLAHMRGDEARAEQMLNRALSLEPGNANATNWLALILIDSDDSADREKALRHAMLNARGYPNNSQANITLAWVLYKMGRKEDAQTALQKGVQAGNVSPDSTYLVAEMMADQGRKEDARRLLANVIANTKNLFVLRDRAEKLLEQLQDGD